MYVHGNDSISWRDNDYGDNDYGDFELLDDWLVIWCISRERAS